MGGRMKRMALVLLLTLASARARGAGSPAGSDPCANLHFTSEVRPGLSDLEKRLACGGPSGVKNVSEEWRDIPAAQRKFHLQTFLQARGYQAPSFEMKGETLWVDPGPKCIVAAVKVEGAPAEFDITRKRLIVGGDLTPKLLDDVKSWTMEELRTEGYACPEVTLSGDPGTRTVSIKIVPGNRDRLTSILEDPIDGVIPGIFRRYDSIEPGDWFSGELVELAEHRVSNEGQLESFRLRVDHCEGSQVVLKQEVVAGKPRVLSFGFGANTEGVVVVEAEWKNTRLGNHASLLDFSVAASTKDQIFNASIDWYPLSYPSRFYLKPLISSDHENLNPYQTITIREGVLASSRVETDWAQVELSAGPVNEFVRTIGGAGPPASHFLFLEGVAKAVSHDYEFYQSNPQNGFFGDFTVDAADQSFLSNVSAQRFQLDVEALWSLNDYSPPLLVFGLRGRAATTLTEPNNSATALVPPPLRQYLGGSQTLRGFGLLELPENQVGALSAAFASFETRLVETLPVGIQPFLFMDVGALGARAFQLNNPLFWSPGFGLRVATPIGNFRGTVAHGYVTGNSDPSASHIQFYLSYGEEF
jgi:outer membrane protein assembly factor BamA